MTVYAVLIANVAICIGYLVVSMALTFTQYRFLFIKRITRVSGALFFLTCGFHHLMNAIELFYRPTQEFHLSMLTPLMVTIDVVQALAIWSFSISADRELREIGVLRHQHEEGTA